MNFNDKNAFLGSIVLHFKPIWELLNLKSYKITLKLVILVIFKKKNLKSTNIEFFGKKSKYILGSLSRSYLFENGHEIVEKKIHCCT